MGDYMSPKRRDVVDRLRRRIEFYRRRQNGVQQQYEFGQNALYEQSRQHALLLRQKWIESRAKKASKTKSKSDNNTTDHRNQIVAKKLKHKLDSNSTENQQLQNHLENTNRFEGDDPSPAKITTPASGTTVDGISSSVSVHIIHQINNVGNTHPDKKISTNVTVNQIVKSQVDFETDITANVEYKQELNEDSKNQSRHNGNSDNNNKVNTDLDPEFVDIFKTFVHEEDIPQEIVNELNRFEEICRCFKNSGNGNGLTTGDSCSMFASDMYVDPNQGPGQVRAPYCGVQSHSAGSSLSEGGLAAETLKQMAAQHQHGHEQFVVKSAVDPFSDLSDTGNYATRNGYSADYYSGIPRSASARSYSGQQQSMGYQSKQQALPSYTQNTNKNLTHYTHSAPSAQSDNGPSSLQQLQNQVAHFNPGPQMEITQTQHMQVSDGSHQMQVSQTQHVQLRQPFPNISLMQQQGFATNSSLSPTTVQSQNVIVSDQMTLQQQQLLQAKMQSDSCQQAHMQQYMGRPPPEYKMQHASNITTGMSPNGLGPNPLQTIQNMVNQTNTHQNQGYSSVKNEANDLQNGIRAAQMSALQQQQMNISMSQGQLSYSNQPMNRQTSYPDLISHQMSGMRAQTPNTLTFNGTIHRNQRPPNVNIGPDGLNISQPRIPQDWSHGMNSIPLTDHRGLPPTTSTNMLQYRTYSSDGLSQNAAQMQQHHQPQRTMHLDTMQSQQAAMMQSNAQVQQMMLQQQRLQMVQQQIAQGSRPSQSSLYGLTTQQQGSMYPTQTNSSQDDILNLLDTTPNQITDFLDVQTSGGGLEANWYDIEDILAK